MCGLLAVVLEVAVRGTAGQCKRAQARVLDVTDGVDGGLLVPREHDNAPEHEQHACSKETKPISGPGCVGTPHLFCTTTRTGDGG